MSLCGNDSFPGVFAAPWLVADCYGEKMVKFLVSVVFLFVDCLEIVCYDGFVGVASARGVGMTTG